jgi:hypothetical protein
MLFLDTETTGLAGGTGTVPFLVGLAWFEDDSLRIEQLLLPTLGREAPMLRRLAERVGAASALVTFNGKTYDWPLLRTRAVLARVPVPTPTAHLDLLHCARRVYRARLTEGVRLVQVEDQVLGLCREHDIAGHEIPGRYFDFLRGMAPASALAPVLEHNALDLVALAALVGRLGHDYLAAGDGGRDDDPRDALGFAQVARRARDPDRATRFARLAADGGLSCPRGAFDAHRLVADLARRRGDVAEERAALDAALAAAEADPLRTARAHLALAKHLEHRAKDLDAALRHAHRTVPAEPPSARDRRVARLERRRARRDELAANPDVASAPGVASRRRPRRTGGGRRPVLREAAGDLFEHGGQVGTVQVADAAGDDPVRPDDEQGGRVVGHPEAPPQLGLGVHQHRVEAGDPTRFQRLLGSGDQIQAEGGGGRPLLSPGGEEVHRDPGAGKEQTDEARTEQGAQPGPGATGL